MDDSNGLVIFILIFLIGLPILLVIFIVNYFHRMKVESDRKETLWNKIRIGMTKKDIEKILGPPKSISEPTLLRSLFKMGFTEVWKYGFLEGEIRFKSGRVVGFKKPT